MFKRVPNHQFLYDRGGSFYFRRAVPLYAREAFGGRAGVYISLNTRKLAEARHRLSAHLAEFETQLAAVILGLLYVGMGKVSQRKFLPFAKYQGRYDVQFMKRPPSS
jgi:hypothetical protein